MLTIEIINDGSHPERPRKGNYQYKVMINGQVIADGRIEDHYRPKGWQEIVRRIAEQHPITFTPPHYDEQFVEFLNQLDANER